MYAVSHFPFMQNFFVDSIVFGYICILLVLTKHTYALELVLFEWKLNFHVFHVYKEFHMKFYCLFPWLCFSHNFCTLTLFDVFSWLCFHKYYMCYINFECWYLCDFHIFIDIVLFYSLLEGFRTSFQDYHKTSCVILLLVEFSIMLKLFSNLFLKTPTL